MPYIARVSLKPKGPPLFPLGQCVATPGALDLMSNTGISPLILIARHVAGDWGECQREDVQTNNAAVRDGFRVKSIYRLPLVEKEGSEKGASVQAAETEIDRVWVITESDRSVTTILLPQELGRAPTLNPS